jgi:hypothetical protein
MILVRDVFHAKYGRGDELVALFKEAFDQMPEAMQTGSSRLMTDLSGRYFTIVTEYEVESLAAWERQFAEMMAQPDTGGFSTRMNELIEWGHREFYTIVQ